MSKKKIAIFHNLKGGGALRATTEIVKRLNSSFNIDIYGFDCGDHFSKNLSNIGDSNYFIQVKLPENFLKLQYFLVFEYKKMHRNLAELINSKDYEFILIMHDYLTKSPYLLRFLKKKTVYICQEEPREFYEFFTLSSNFKQCLVNLIRLYLKYEDKKNIRSANIILTNSYYSKEKISRIYKRKDVKVLTHGVDLNRFYRKKLKKEKYYMTVGSLAKFKGIDFLIKTISLLPKKYRYPLLCVGGNGRDKKKIIKLANTLGIKINIKRSVEDDELINLYNKASLFLFSAVNEPLGLCVLEALACGLKVVAVKEGGVVEIIKKSKQGTLCQRNIHIFAKTIIKMLKKKDNYSYEKKYLEKNWNWNHSVRQINKL